VRFAEEKGRQVSAVELVYAVPAHDLVDTVSFYYQFSSALDRFDDKAYRADLPQLCYILQGSDGFFSFGDGPVQAMFPVHILGPTTMHGHTGGSGPICLFGMGIKPLGWSRMVRAAAGSFTNRVVDAEQFFGDRTRTDFAVLQNAENFDERVELANGIVRQLLCAQNRKIDNFVDAVEKWLLSSLSPGLDELRSLTGLTEKQLQRLCNKIYGSPPKALARKYRALRAAIQIAKGEVDPLDLVVEGYTDQSHLIRDIKHYTGHTPNEIRNNPSQLLTLTLERTNFEGMSELITGT
jgi:AraC-like DNA-binding protein